MSEHRYFYQIDLYFIPNTFQEMIKDNEINETQLRQIIIHVLLYKCFKIFQEYTKEAFEGEGLLLIIIETLFTSDTTKLKDPEHTHLLP